MKWITNRLIVRPTLCGASLAVLLALSGGGGSSAPPSIPIASSSSSSATTYSLSGTITGLNTSGLVLTNYAADVTTILDNATTFTMNTALSDRASYNVAALSAPTGLS